MLSCADAHRVVSAVLQGKVQNGQCSLMDILKTVKYGVSKNSQNCNDNLSCNEHIQLLQHVMKVAPRLLLLFCKYCNKYLFSVFKESRGQALRDPLEHHFVLKISHFWGQVGPGRASPHATCKALNRYCNKKSRRLVMKKFFSCCQLMQA